MADQADVRRIALSLPETSEGRNDSGQVSFSVLEKGKAKGFAWTWLERVDPKKGRVPNHSVIALRVADQEEKEMLLEADPLKFFTEPHYNGYPAILVRLPAIGVDELEGLIVEAWRCQAPRALVERWRGEKGV